MATAYTSILKLALPVQGELSGTWGDVVNDNITSMVEEAIAGRAVINTWTTNSHTLTSADGTTSESRCAMLEFTDTGTVLTGDATVVCPTAAKIYICKNDSGQKVTIKTSAGTGVAIADGQTMFVFCDGTNVVEAVTSMSSLKLGTAVTSIEVTSILDEDDLVSDSATALATQQSIKAYVDSQVTAQDLDFAGDSGTGAVDLDSQSLTIAGTSNEIETSAADQTLTIGLPDAVTVTTSVTTPTVQVTDVKANDGTAAVSIADSTGQTTITDAVLTTADINGGTIDGTTIGATTATTGAFTTVTSSGNTTVSGQLVTDTISEETVTAGVTVDGVLLKDGQVTTDQINEETADAGVTVDGVVLKDGGATFTADVSLGANDELTFNSTDLRIFSDGADSFVKEGGSGNLRLQGANVQIETGGGNLYFSGASNVAKLYHTNVQKLATTLSGIDVDGTINADDVETSTISANDGTTAINIANSTGAVDIDTSLNVDGTVTADGLTVDGDATFTADFEISGLSPKIFLNETDTTDVNTRIRNASGNLQIQTVTDSDSSPTTRFNIDHSTGDITFYDGANASFVYDADAGTTINDNQDARDFTVKSDNNDAMLYVDGASDLVAIGHGSPSAILDVKSTTAVVSTLRGTTSSIAYLDITNYATSAVGAGSGIEFRANSSVQERQVGFITADWTDNTDATRDSRMDFHININGGTTRMLKLGVSDVIVNSGNHDTNFQVRSVNQDNMLFVDAAEDRIGVGIGAPLYKLHVYAADNQLATFESTDANANIGFKDSATTNVAQVGVKTDDLFFAAGGAEVARFTSTGELQLDSDSAFKTDSTATSATTETAVYSFSATDYTGAKFLVCVTDSTATERYITELLVTHDGTTAVATEYGQVATDTALATFDVDISGGNVRLLATPASSNSMTFKVMSTQLLA